MSSALLSLADMVTPTRAQSEIRPGFQDVARAEQHAGADEMRRVLVEETTSLNVEITRRFAVIR